ncbi:MAG: polysaccharide biosynthesis/export family protein [Candidatus Korobacteraceae bacterium]
MHRTSSLQIRPLLCSLFCLAMLVPIALGAHASAQAAITTIASKSQPAVGPNNLKQPQVTDSDSIISPDDVLDIYVMDVGELSRQYRVSPAGKVVLPLLPAPLNAAGMTPSQFSEELGKQLREKGLVSDPHIVVTILSSRLKSVAITGAVHQPQIYPVFGKTTLLDLLSQAQGLSDDASNLAVISRGDLGAQETNSTDRVVTVDLKKLLQTGDAKYNIDIYPGDRVTVPHAGVVYVVGAVNKPGGFVIRAPDNGMTVLQAVAMAEDTKGTAVRDKAMIIRPNSAQADGHEQIPLNLNQILAGKQPDKLLHADDILFIPDSTAKKAFRRGLEAAIQAATGLAVYGRF